MDVIDYSGQFVFTICRQIISWQDAWQNLRLGWRLLLRRTDDEGFTPDDLRIHRNPHHDLIWWLFSQDECVWSAPPDKVCLDIQTNQFLGMSRQVVRTLLNENRDRYDKMIIVSTHTSLWYINWFDQSVVKQAKVHLTANIWMYLIKNMFQLVVWQIETKRNIYWLHKTCDMNSTPPHWLFRDNWLKPFLAAIGLHGLGKV